MPVATITAGKDLILAFFQTGWDLISSNPTLVYADVSADVPAGTVTWGRISVQMVDSDQVTLSGATGTKRFTRRGLVSIELRAPFGDGSTVADDLAQEVVNILEANGSTAPDEVLFRRVRAIDIGQDGPWKQTNVLADFEFDTVK